MVNVWDITTALYTTPTQHNAHCTISGSSDATPSPLDEPCEFNSCPVGSPAYGSNASEPRFNYVNSYPVTSIKHEIDTLAAKFFNNSPPDLAVTGPNVGANAGLAVPISGTVGAATYAASTAGIPTIAFAGVSGTQTAWNTSSLPLYSQIYAALATNLTNHLLASGTPYLRQDIWLNVNFPRVTDDKCSSVEDFKFVLSRIHIARPLITVDDVEICGKKRLPSELEVLFLTPGCYASVSVGIASEKTNANSTMQGVVLEKLGGLLSCLP